MRFFFLFFLLLAAAATAASAADKIIVAGETHVLTTDTTWDNLYSTAEPGNWAIVRGNYDIIVSDETDISYVSFQNTGTVTFSASSNDNLSVSYCVFDGPSQVTFGSKTSSVAAPFSVTYSDFRNQTAEPAIIIRGAEGASTATYEFNHNTLTYPTQRYISFKGRDNLEMKHNVLYNSVTGDAQSTAGNLVFESNFVSADSSYPSGGKLFFTRMDEAGNSYLNNYFYIDYPNAHMATIAAFGPFNPEVRTWSYNVIEGTDDEANYLFVRDEKGIRITNNIVIGEGTLLSNVGAGTGATANVINNTLHVLGADTAGSLYITETGICTSCEITLQDNIVDLDGVALYPMVNHYVNGDPIENIHYAGHNNVRGYSTPYAAEFSFTKQDADTSLNPTFVDSTRNLATWSTSKGGLGTKADAVDNFLAKNGYNSTTKTQSDTPSGYAAQEIVNWVTAGFKPENATLATSGRTGGYVGAVDASATPSPLSITINPPEIN